jgi:hypothetical protein
MPRSSTKLEKQIDGLDLVRDEPRWRDDLFFDPPRLHPSGDSHELAPHTPGDAPIRVSLRGALCDSVLSPTPRSAGLSSLQVVAGRGDRRLLSALASLDACVVEAVADNSERWFQSGVDPEDAESLVRRSTCVDRSGRTLLSLRVRGEIEHAEPGEPLDVDLELEGLVFCSNTFFVAWRLTEPVDEKPVSKEPPRQVVRQLTDAFEEARTRAEAALAQRREALSSQSRDAKRAQRELREARAAFEGLDPSEPGFAEEARRLRDVADALAG